MQTIIKVLFSIIIIFSLIISNGYTKEEKNRTDSSVIIKVGTTQNIDSQVLKYIKGNLKTNYNISLEIIHFETAKSANKAVAEGKIDANIAQNEPYFTSYLQEYQYNIISLGKVYVKPMGIYSKNYKKLVDVPKNATIVLLESNMDDKTILGRELLLLQKAGLLSLKPYSKVYSISMFDIVHDDSRKVLLKNALTEKNLIESYNKNDADLFILDQSVLSKIKKNSSTLLILEDLTTNFPRVLVAKPNNKHIKYLRQIYDVIISPDTSNFIRKEHFGELIPITN